MVTKLSNMVYRIQHVKSRRKRKVVHFNQLKSCPQDIRFPEITVSRPQVALDRNPESEPVPPGTTSELLEDPDPDPIDTVTLNPAPNPSEMSTLIGTESATDTNPPTLPHPPNSPTQQGTVAQDVTQSRYPRWECSAPDRLFVAVRH